MGRGNRRRKIAELALPFEKQSKQINPAGTHFPNGFQGGFHGKQGSLGEGNNPMQALVNGRALPTLLHALGERRCD
ncbi:hypothetical protein LGN04_22025 [Burkholderia multivorans]|nr:hypothetical protein [Burkholderia multivorans]